MKKNNNRIQRQYEIVEMSKPLQITYDMDKMIVYQPPDKEENNNQPLDAHNANNMNRINRYRKNNGMFESNNNISNQENNSNVNAPNELHKMNIGFLLN